MTLEMRMYEALKRTESEWAALDVKPDVRVATCPHQRHPRSCYHLGIPRSAPCTAGWCLLFTDDEFAIWETGKQANTAQYRAPRSCLESRNAELIF